jgi:hypothetical protein
MTTILPDKQVSSSIVSRVHSLARTTGYSNKGLSEWRWVNVGNEAGAVGVLAVETNETKERTMRKVILCAVIMLLVTVLTVSAKGTFDQIILSGPGLLETVTLTNDSDVLPLSMTALEEFPLRLDDEISALNVSLGEGYELQRQYMLEGGAFMTFDRVRYFPDPFGGQGYVLYVGIENGSSEYDGHYYRATEEGEATIQRILAENGIVFETGAEIEAGLPEESGTIVSRWLSQLVGMAL